MKRQEIVAMLACYLITGLLGALMFFPREFYEFAARFVK